MFLNMFKTGLLFFIFTGLVLGGGYLIAGQQGLIYALIFAGVGNFIGFFFSDKIALAMVSAQEVGPEHELHGIVAGLVQRAGLPMPRVYVSPEQAPNAFATGRGPSSAAVCATDGLLQILNRDEIAGVMAHELSHVKHRDILIQSVAATLAGAVTYLGYMFYFSGGRRSNNDGDSHPLGAVAGLLFLILGPIAALIQAALSRQREYAADTGGAQMLGDPRPLASALQKIDAYAHRIPMNVNPAYNSMFIIEPLSAMQTMANLFSTHPPLEKRLENLLGQRTATQSPARAW